MSYKYIRNGDFLRECSCCGYDAPLKNYPEPPHRDKERLLCEVCANTIIGRLVDFKGHDDRAALAQCVNLLLDKLTNRRAGEAS